MPGPARTVRVVADAGELALAGAATFVATCRMAPEGSGIVVSLAGGTTPRAMHHLLTRPGYADQVPWERVTVIFGDERCVPPDHPESNYGMARDTLLAPLGIPAGHVLRMRGEAGAEVGAQEYEQALRELPQRTAGGLPVIDLLFLGLGEDGHTASLFPGTPAVHETRRLVVPGFNSALQSHRITLSPAAINASRLVVFMVAGIKKAEVLRRILEDEGPIGEHPARAVKPRDGHVLWLVDREAASRLAPATIGSEPTPVN